MASTIQYVGPLEEISIGEVVVAHGKTAEVDAEVAKELLKRDDFVRPKAAKKAPAKKAEAKTSVAPAADETPAADAPGNPPQEG